MLDYGRGLAAPQIADVIATAEPLDEPATMRYPGSVRHHHERLGTVPRGHLVVGDGLCSFNPVYGQGMTVAAMQAQLLRRLLGAGRADLPARFYRAASTVLDRPWALAAGGDLRFPSVAGHRPVGSALVERYLGAFRAAASTDDRLGTAFIRVINMVDAPSALLTPALALRVLLAALRRRRTSAPQHHGGAGHPGDGGRAA